MRTAAVWIVLAACGHTSNGVLPDGSGGSNHDVHVDGAIDASPVCGKRGGMRGKTNRMVNAGGLDRTYIVYLPDVSPTEAVPLVFVHHGYTMSGQNMYDITGYTALADREHVAVAFPDGQGGPGSLGAPWNVGANVCTSYEGVPPDAPGDDFAFLDAMKADIEQDQCLDTAHTFVTGFSMGGYFSHHVACERADIAGVAPHSGGTHDLDACPVAKKPIIMFHGASDLIVPDGCDDPNANPPAQGAAAARWAAHNGCAATTTSHAVNNGTCVLWDGCPAGGQVELCTFNNMGHCWAGGIGVNVYACNGYESATELTWSFWKQYAW